MGKDRKGKELGQGLSQRKDGLYTARFVTKTGYRKQGIYRCIVSGILLRLGLSNGG